MASESSASDDPEFHKELLMTIGASTREISELVVQLYQSRRMTALDRLTNAGCRVGPKMDRSIAGGSRPRKDDTMNDLALNSKKGARKSLARNGGFATEKAWIDARLSYRRLVYRMIRDIESHCDDVICLTQNFLKLPHACFQSLCNQEQVDLIISGSEDELHHKQEALRREIAASMEDDDDSSSSAASSSERETPESCEYALQDPLEKKYSGNQS